ncbi:thermonuclease family protein [Oricola sp.]|uniref:thermonuclease family protein n=1 Tax=Oricola sp. TaxID=1979950 RepID=UPI0035121656
MRNTDPDLLLAVETYGRGARFFSARSLIAFVVVIVFALIGGTTWFLLDSDEPVETVFEAEPESFFTSSLTGDVAQGYDFYEGLEARPMPFCGSGANENCVVDGEIFWLNGEEIRIANIDAPQLEGRCLSETARAREARATLQQLLDNQPIELRGKGRDAFGRVLAEVHTSEGDVGRKMVRFNVAATWKGREEPVSTWCGG